jgi:hypothetical protein
VRSAFCSCAYGSLLLAGAQTENYTKAKRKKHKAKGLMDNE